MPSSEEFAALRQPVAEMTTKIEELTKELDRIKRSVAVLEDD